jgi:LIVCS family branched-chain amino acid:cation transporter
MKHTKRIFIFGFALFAGFFGAGNLILPPQLGFNSGPDWWLVTIGFMASATLIPLLSLLGHAKLQGTMLDFAKKVSPKFSLFYCILMYLIIVALPAPRTAAVTHEMAVAPLLGTQAWLTSVVYFILVFVFVMNRSKALNILGKFLTPIIVFMVLLIIILGLTTAPQNTAISEMPSPLINGFLEGYQTYDALAGMVMGGVIVISLNAQGFQSYKEKRNIIAKSGLLAMFGLFVIYAGLIALGARFNLAFSESISRTDLLLALSEHTLGHLGTTFVGVLVALACFTTAVAIIVSIADFFKTQCHQSDKAYLITALVCCISGGMIGSYEVGWIIQAAIPALLFIYPISIVLIILNLLKDTWATPLVFKLVAITALVFSLPDVLLFIFGETPLTAFTSLLPLAQYNLAWLLPSLLVFFLTNLLQRLNLLS